MTWNEVLRDLVDANHILANEGVLDGYGHVSIRHPEKPERYLLSCSKSPDQVEVGDIIEYYQDGSSVHEEQRPPYSERFIHGAIYEARPDINAVIHSHAEDVLPFSITDVPFIPVIHVASAMGPHVPVWDIADKFGLATSLLVVDMAQGRDLAAQMGDGRVVLMRGHGFSAAARTLIELVKMAVYIPRNARVQMAALRMGTKIKPLHGEEISARRLAPTAQPDAPDMRRAWEYWTRRARGCPHCAAERLNEVESQTT